MPRSVPEWIGKTPDEKPPQRVRVRVFERKGGRCHECTRKIAAGETWTLEHKKALINGGQNRERNLDVTCAWCLPVKNAEDVKQKSDNYRRRSKHIGAVPKSKRPMAGSRDSAWKHTINHGWVRR